MSGIDEQHRVFKCPVCDGLEYWVLRTASGIEGGRGSTCLGFLNNLKASRQIIKKPPLLQVTFRHSQISLLKLLTLTEKVLCSNCRHRLVLDGPIWGQISKEIRKGWEGRGVR